MAQGSARATEKSDAPTDDSAAGELLTDRVAAPAPTAIRVTVNLSKRSADALDEASRITDNTKTEVINKSIQLWALVQTAQLQGGGIWVKESKEAELALVRFF